jgi:predicted short-subunit dehydrogenase-like oxidoreductase (DUF2520 family)
MIKVVIIGSGNVAHHLIKAFSESSEIEIIQAFARNKAALSNVLESHQIISDFRELKKADLYIIAVSDDAINWVSEQLLFTDRLVVHTSGSAAIAEINSKNRRGVFYPVQSVSKNKSVDFKSIPIGIEAENDSDLKTIEMLANSISEKVFQMDSSQRKALHVAAVFVNNFVNYMYQIGSEICTENRISFDILKPLIEETVKKIDAISPKEAQTGPAIRNDKNTINAHLEFLLDENKKNIYKILTQSIQENGKKL